MPVHDCRRRMKGLPECRILLQPRQFRVQRFRVLGTNKKAYGLEDSPNFCIYHLLAARWGIAPITTVRYEPH
jgi:hypothetical protein